MCLASSRARPFFFSAWDMPLDVRACAVACGPSVHAIAPVIAGCAQGAVSDAGCVLEEAASLLLRSDADAWARVAVAFRPCLLELVARTWEHAHAVHALAYLIGAFEEIYTLLEAFLRRHYAHGLPMDEAHLVSLWRMLRAAPHLAHTLQWPSSTLYCVFASREHATATRCLAIECYAAQEHLSNAARDALRDAWIGDAPALLTHMDVRTMPVHEQQRIDAIWRACEACPLTPTDAPVPLESVSSSLSLLGDMIVDAPPCTDDGTDPFICTSGALDAIQRVLLHVTLRLPVLLSGPPASGKTHLLTYLATRLARTEHGMPPYLSIPLGDQSGVDAKALIGSYVSSTTRPGTFEFVEGALTRAVRAGMWVILEDLDKASTDVLSVIAPLAEALGPTKAMGTRPVLDLGARGRIEAAPGFALLATRSTRTSAARPMFLSSEHWGEVRLAPPRTEDVLAILRGRCPSLRALPSHECACLVQAWYDAIEASQRAPSSVRQPTLRELVQWCARLDAMHAASLLNNPVVQDALFLDACDVFLASFADTSTPVAQSMASALSKALHMSSERASYAMRERVPDLALGHAGHVRVGRVSLDRLVPGAPTLQRYALTRSTLASMERVAACIAHAEPALLVGETGTGKTTMVQTLASLVGQPITVINLSQQTESGDLLGAFKPLDPKRQAADIHNAWTRLFERTFSLKRNGAYLDAERKAFFAGKWSRLAKLWSESCRLAQRELAAQSDARKKRRTDGTLDASWRDLLERVTSFTAMFASGQRRHFAFSFVEGPLVRAVRQGHWILLDEINLASPETLDCLAPLLQSRHGSIVLTERGDLTPVPRHAQFRLFACMNPATDVGKRDLPPSVRARFTEVYVPSPDADLDALTSIVSQYIGQEAVSDKSAILDVAEWYTAVRHAAMRHELADGANQRPHYSVRTLARALTFAATLAPSYGLRRALAEGVQMSFGMLLDAPSALAFSNLVQRHLLSHTKDRRIHASFVPPAPHPHAIQVGAFWLETGPVPPDDAPDYVLTPSVEAKIGALARALVTRQSPVLIQGPTSAGKTSAVEYLARRTGHRFVRINNHEHTDVQEYLGAYASNAEGQLVFTEGLLVTALRRGDWLVLDELNLAPTDVLEALNRLLDDNRELLIPETGEIVKPHPHFMLFATQNPPGAYAGRKMLSRAFRNRFVELHFDDVPQSELASILTTRCAIPPSWADKIVAVFAELQRRRESGRVFEKHAFATLRDLFRWGMRGADGYQQLAETGYMLLAERTRHARDAETVRDVLQQVMRVHIDPEALYDRADTLAAQLGPERLAALQSAAQHHRIVWTSAMRRLVCLTAAALQQNEPVLLVGETGAGKTSVCDIVATAFGRPLHSFNCHQNTDSADLLGGQRPLRNRAALASEARVTATPLLGAPLDDVPLEQVAAQLRSLEPSEARDHALALTQQALALFTWCDGPLVEAMRHGDMLLLDEISLADDSVLERLNSVLERERTLVLAEKAGTDVVMTASEGFQILATMNPGGDYGKKELSPALRNRFTEIYVPPVERTEDQAAIINAILPVSLHAWTPPMLSYVQWFAHRLGGHDHTGLGVRDLVGWAMFVRDVCERGILPPPLAFAHGAALTIIDALGTLPATAAMTQAGLHALRMQCYQQVNGMIEPAHLDPLDPAYRAVQDTPEALYVGPFAMPKGPAAVTRPPFLLQAATTADNALRVLRACTIRGRSVLLEGSPGAGKTSLITSLAAMTGHELVRINLSEQTELVDLFGGELPVEHGRPGEFAWRPAAFLDAMQRGAWVLLDEMNLASQTVLEGLNSCLDHRGSVYVPDIGRTFTKHPDFRLFAAQNPQHQGGARKGLPKSLLNRFIKVYVAELQDADIRVICEQLYPDAAPYLDAMVSFHAALHKATQDGAVGRHGAPWELNLRDQLRWLQVMHADLGLSMAEPLDALRCLYLARFRTPQDRQAVAELFATHFGDAGHALRMPHALVSPTDALLGHVHLSRAGPVASASTQLLLPSQLACLEGMAVSVRLGLLTIITGHAGTGKSSVVRTMAALAGMHLDEVRLSSASDTMDVLGSFEQYDPAYAQRHAAQALDQCRRAIQARSHLSDGAALEALDACRRCLPHDLAQAAQYLAPFATTDEAASLHAMIEQLQGPPPSGGQFSWIDGPLVRAAKQGHWVLLDHANLCAASVLDRLNSLFEPGGSLVLSERGMVDGGVPHIVPHPAFRVFMTVDPRHGELSRAMRNRGMELWLDALDLDRLTPFARSLCAHGTLVERAVQAHAARRGVPTESAPLSAEPSVRAASAHAVLKEAGMPGAAFVAACLQDETLAEAAHIYAAQALTPAERALVQRVNVDLPSGASKGSLLPLDARRHPDMRTCDDIEPRAVELLVRCHMRTASLAAPPPGSLLWQVQDDVHQVPILIQSMLAFLEACIHVAQTAASSTNGGVLAQAGTLLDLVSFLESALHHTDLDYSLVHVMLRSIRTAVSELAQRQVAVPASLVSLMRTMQQAPRATHTGVAMQALWMRTLPHVPPPMLPHITALEATYMTQTLSPSQARTVLQVLATLYVCNASWTEEQCRDLARLAQELCALPSPTHTTSWPYVARVLPVLLWTLASCRDARLSQLVSLWSAYPSVPAPLVVGSQLCAWSPTTTVSPMLQMRWPRAFWYAPDGSFSVDAPGAHALHRAVILPAVLDAVHVDRIALSAWPSYDAHLHDLATSIATACVPAQAHRLTLLRDMLHTFTMFLSEALVEALQSSLSPDMHADVDGLHEAVQAHDYVRIAHMVRTLCRRCEADASWHSALQAWLQHLAHAHDCLSAHKGITELGRAWVQLALWTLHIYIPDVPLDPVAEAHAKHSFGMSIHARLSRQAHVEEAAETFRSGGCVNAVVQQLQTAMSDVLTRLESSRHTRVTRPPATALLHRLHGELSGFASQVLAPARVERLVSRMSASDSTAIAEEASLQSSLHAFEHRLWRHYVDLHDLTAPVLVALEQMRLGLRLCLPTSPVPGRTERLASAATRFPSSYAAQTLLIDAAEPRAVSTAVPELLLVLACAAYEVQTTHSRAAIQAVYTAYEQLYILWAQQRESDREKAEAEAQLFTFKDEDASEEQARLDAEIRALFPVYDDVLETQARMPSSSDTPRLDEHVMLRVLDLHMALFPSAMARSTQRSMPSVPDMLVQATDSLLRTSAPLVSSMPMEMDRTAAFQLARIARRRAPPTRSTNFYHDAQPLEIARLMPILERLRARATELLHTIPEQVQLQQLVERCDRIAMLDVASPVAKGLAAVELLLTHVDDWQTYASRDTSLQAHATELTNLVVEWRRLELHSWKTLLDDEAAREEASVAPWFFSLYEALTRASHGPSAPELVELLDTFVRGSTAGQLSTRLALLDSFSMFRGPSHLQSILHNTAAYYAQFVPAIEAHLSQQRDMLDREVADFVKLATWRDVNVYALKQSAQKTHAYLHKSLRKFRDILRQPADPLLASKADVRPAIAVRPLLGPAYVPYDVVPETASDTYTPSAFHATRPPHLQDMKRTILHLSELSTHTLLPQLESQRYLDVVDMGTTILETADALAQQTPSVANEGNMKLIKSLATQKRRAWTDLIKALRFMGLSPFVTAELLAHNRDPMHVYGVAPLSSSHTALGLDAVSQYYAAMLAQAERLRLASQSPKGDVPDLVRGIAIVEHIVQLCLRVRQRLSNMLQGARDVWALAQRLGQLQGNLVSMDQTFVLHVQGRAHDFARLLRGLDEYMASLPMHQQVSPLPTSPDLAPVQSLQTRVREVHAQLEALASALSDSGITLCTEQEFDMVATSTHVLQDAQKVFEQLADTPSLTLLAVPMRDWLETISTPIACHTREENAASVQSLSDKVCSSMLVIAQELHKQPTPVQGGDALPERWFVDEVSKLHAIDRILRPQAVAGAIRDAMATAGTGPVTMTCVQDMNKFLAPYTQWLWTHMSCVSLWNRSMMRLTLVLSVLMTSLATQGFCQPPEESQGEDDQDAEGGDQLEGGTGLGDGTGAKDVSDTLQDDENMEELEKEDQAEDDEPEATKGEDKAREMDDMDGDVHSVDGEQGEEADDDGEEQEQDVEDEVGDIDPLDPDAVDEKMWGDEPENEKQGESEAQGGAEDDREQAGDRNEAQQREEGDAQDQAEEEEQQDEHSGDNDADEEAEVEDMPELNEGLGRELDQEAKEHDMQLGDLDLGEQDEDEEDNDMQDDENLSLPEGDIDEKEDETANFDEHDTQETRMDTDEHDVHEGEEQNRDEQASEKDHEDGSEEQASDPPDPEPKAREDEEKIDEVESSGDKPQNARAPPPMPMDQHQHETLGEKDSDPMDFDATHEGGGEDTGGAAGQQDRAKGEAGQADGSSATQDQGAHQDANEQAAQGTGDEEKSEAQPNPTQSIADSLDQFRRDVESIREATQHDQDAAMKDGGVPESSDMEHVAHDDDADAQALGTADEQQAQAMKQLSMDDDNAAGETLAVPEQDQDMDMPDSSAPPDLPEPEGSGSQPRGAREGAMMASDVLNAHGTEGDNDLPKEEEDEEHMEPIADEQRVEADQHVAEELEDFRTSDADANRASELWRSYSALTSDLAFGLCEQLRLILAPTLATRLNGDYRTGKRLNMRKIIPFIASDFAKDKIWLRRTKPSAREYQVLLAMDDSKSMAESRNIHLAYQTLALVSGALTRLEIGDIGICRFGSQMDMLHDFGSTTFTDRHGGQILQRLRFQQTRTDMFALLEQSMRVLRRAREQHASASAADLWQLEIIISDGVCQDHAKLKALLRRAAEERIMIVFVIVDACDESAPADTHQAQRSSILAMNQVNYHMDAAGKLQLEMKHYIDTFPFDYYVIVRDVQSLPQVLATTLCQWAERIRDA